MLLSDSPVEARLAPTDCAHGRTHLWYYLLLRLSQSNTQGKPSTARHAYIAANACVSDDERRTFTDQGDQLGVNASMQSLVKAPHLVNPSTHGHDLFTALVYQSGFLQQIISAMMKVDIHAELHAGVSA